MDNDSKHHVQNVRSLPSGSLIKKFLSKGKDKLLNATTKISNNAFGTGMTDKKFLKKVCNSKYQFQNLGELQKYLRKRTEPKFFIDSLKWKDAGSFIHEECLNVSDKTITEANEICEHIFDLLGSRPIKVYYGMRSKGFEDHCYNTQISGRKPTIIGHSSFTSDNYKPIDWHIDFKSGYRWNPKTYYENIKYGNRAGVDVKVPWELSRFQHLAILGQAYWVTNNEKYVKEFVNQITDWIENNPPKFGVNWTCTMDVAIRACNWILGYCFFKDSKVINQQFLFKFLKSLYQHGCHIIRNLEKNEVLTFNHYLSDIAGLVYLGVLFPEFKDAKKWKEFGVKELVKEMEKQVYPDGVDFEASTCYHRLALELFFYTTFVVIINDNNFKEDNFIEVGNEIFGEEYLQRLYKMFEFVLYALKPNGRMPQIGDNDDGRLYIFNRREVLDMRYLLTLGAIFFREPKFKIKEFGFCEEALWVFGEKGSRIWQDLEENSLANIGSRAFPDAGWYIMRNDKDYMFVSCGPNGQNGNGGHSHNDKLSFELCIDGQDIIVDPGTYVYTAEPMWRNKFRSTAYHNTVVVDGKEQNRFDGKDLFRMRNDAKIKINKWDTNDEMDILIGEHYGYKRFSQPIIHKREIKYYKKDKKWEIIDKFRGEGEHGLEWNLILSPEFRRNLNVGSDRLQWHRKPTFYSEYGIITRIEKLASTLKTRIPVEVEFCIKV